MVVVSLMPGAAEEQPQESSRSQGGLGRLFGCGKNLSFRHTSVAIIRGFVPQKNKDFGNLFEGSPVAFEFGVLPAERLRLLWNSPRDGGTTLRDA
jgi:hypothetical protein